MSAITTPELLAVAEQLAAVTEANNHYQAGLARHLSKLDLPIERLTIRQLLAVQRHYHELYNRIHQGVAS